MALEKVNIRLSVVIEMTHWINANIHREIHATDVTKQSGYKHWHFQRLFRDVTGYTLSEYIRLTRVLNVAYALAHSPLKITHICYDNGFPSQQALARLFRRYCHCTPTEFRRCADRNPEFFTSVRGGLLTRQAPLKRAACRGRKACTRPAPSALTAEPTH